MVEFFTFTIFLLLALLGISEALCIFINWLLKPQKNAKKYLVIILEKGFAEQQLMQASENFNWRGYALADKIVAFTGGLETDEIYALNNRFGCNKNIIFSDVINIEGI